MFLTLFANANEIDKLSTKEDVQKFLASKLSNKGIVFANKCVDISQVQKIRMSLSEKIEVVDPITGEIIRTEVVSREPDTNDRYWDFPFVSRKFDDIASMLDTGGYQFYRADLDGNEYTDLIVDAGIIIVVMDMVSGIEGYMFSEVPFSLTFQNIISLPDRSKALLLKYKHCGADTAAVDTIIYKFNAFVKYHPTYKPVGIRKINYYFQCSSGMIPYERYNCMQINKDGLCFMKYHNPNPFEPDNYDTTFSATLDSRQIDGLLNLVAYINIKSYKDVYDHGGAHGEGGTFVIHYDDGAVKTIRIWSCPPPTSLGYLSKNIAAISRELKWQSSNTQPDFECPCRSWGNESTTDCGCEW